MVTMDNFVEASEEEIDHYLKANGLDRPRNWWWVREHLRTRLNGSPPAGCSDWGIWWKCQ